MSRFARVREPSAFRRMAAAMWDAPRDPSIYGSLDLDATEALALVRAYRERGVRLTMTHVVAKAVATALHEHPTANTKVRFGGRLEARESVDVFVSVMLEGGKDLSGVRIDRCDEKSLEEIVGELEAKAKKVRSGDDASYEKSRSMFRVMPAWLTRPALRLSDFLVNELHLDAPSLGMPVDPMGSALVTNVGSFGVDTAFAPFTPIGRYAMLVLVTEVRERPVVRDGQVVARPILRLCATFDHRIVDGVLAGRLAKSVTAAFEAPAA